MSDIAEMAKELARALKLGDIPAAEHIASELEAEAERLDMSDLANDLESVLRRGLYGAIPAIVKSMASQAAAIDRLRIDQAMHQLVHQSFMGDGFREGHRLLNAAMDEAGVR